MIGLIIGVICFALLIYFLSWYFGNQSSLSAYAEASEALVIPATKISNPISANYTYSIWIYVQTWSVTGKKTIFKRDGSKPLMQMRQFDNTVDTLLQLSDDTTVTCSVSNVPLQKWSNITIVVNDRSLDSYLNGKLVKTCVLPVLAKMPTEANAAVYLTPDGGFSGFTARFKYWGEGINPQEAWNIYTAGPGGNIFTNFFSTYQLQLNFIKGNETKASITI
jgi:hypothetical protein